MTFFQLLRDPTAIAVRAYDLPTNIPAAAEQLARGGGSDELLSMDVTCVVQGTSAHQRTSPSASVP